MAQAVKKRPAKISSKNKDGGGVQTCPTCEKDMSVVKMVRQTAPSGMFWVCDSGHEIPTR